MNDSDHVVIVWCEEERTAENYNDEGNMAEEEWVHECVLAMYHLW